MGIKRFGLFVAMIWVMSMPTAAQIMTPGGDDCCTKTENIDEERTEKDHHDRDHREKGGKKSSEEMLKEIQEFKLKYLAQEMGLSEAQKKDFNEIYTQMSMEKGKILRECHELEKEMKETQNLTDEDYARASEKLDAAREKETLIGKMYDAKFASFLTAKQIYKMKQAEKAFLEKLRDMRRHRRASGKK